MRSMGSRRLVMWTSGPAASARQRASYVYSSAQWKCSGPPVALHRRSVRWIDVPPALRMCRNLMRARPSLRQRPSRARRAAVLNSGGPPSGRSSSSVYSGGRCSS